MSATNRRPLARVIGDVLIDEHHDGHGHRKMIATPAPGGVLVVIEHGDGRTFRATVPCLACAAKVPA